LLRCHYRQLQDLLSLNQILEDRIKRLVILEDILNERQEKRQKQIGEYQSLFIEEHLLAYQQQLTDRQAEYQAVIEQGDYLQFISEESEQLLTRIEQSLDIAQSRNSIAEFIDDKAMDVKEARLKFYKGLLLWESAQDFAQNSWEKQQQLHAAKVELERLIGLKSSVENILNTAVDFYPYFQRVAAMQNEAEILQASLDRELDETKERTFARLISHLQNRKENLRLHLTQARLALLRINEELGIASDHEGAL